MSNLNNIKNLNNIENMDNLDKLDLALNNLEKINSFMQLITDYVDYREIDTEKSTQANIIATFYEINRNKPHILNLCYECLEKIDNTAELLQDLNIK